jgi:hypothetical protein
VGVNGNRQKPLYNPSASPFLKAESQAKDNSAVAMKALMTKIEQRFFTAVCCGPELF